MRKLVLCGLALVFIGGLSWAQGKVEILGVWSGEELESFQAVLKPFIAATGIKVEFVGTRDLAAVLTTRVVAGNPPDLAILPNPGQMVDLAKGAYLVPLDTLMDMGKLRADYGATLDDGSYNGRVYGFFFKMAVKSLVWYNPQALFAAGYAVPDSWNELIYVSEKLTKPGVSPWAIGLESGAATGWAGTDWIEDILLRTAGPEIYDQWVRHEIPWTHPAVELAFQIFGGFVKHAYGGGTGMATINFGDSPAALFAVPPAAYFHRQASFITGFFPAGVVAEVDYDFFAFPSINPKYGVPVLTGGDLVVAFRDRPEVRKLMDYLASADAQAIWAKRGGYLTANKSLSLAVSPDELTRKMAQMLVEATVARFDASDLMPAAVGAGAFWQGVVDYVTGVPLDTVLRNIERAAQAAY
ncbi:MAG: extracellular solute-binding protein [Candidatus Bipolaricaulota bacterium]